MSMLIPMSMMDWNQTEQRNACLSWTCRKIEGLTHDAAQCAIAVSSLENLGRGVGTLLRYVLSIRFDSDVVFVNEVRFAWTYISLSCVAALLYRVMLRENERRGQVATALDNAERGQKWDAEEKERLTYFRPRRRSLIVVCVGCDGNSME